MMTAIWIAVGCVVGIGFAAWICYELKHAVTLVDEVWQKEWEECNAAMGVQQANEG